MTDASVNEAIDGAADKAQRATDKAKKVADRTIDDAKGGAKDGAARLTDTADKVKKTVTDQANAAKDWANDRAGVAKDWALDQGDVLRDTVQTRPFASVGVSAGSAFLAGLVLGLLLARR